ncbi:hypothetical protein [uncultured Fibrella sp.]|uniref:hypothetical protein n=1 Tax=uncultured Fibrella sp. TaxID=1284596 RepID=UPI0035CAA34D
MIDIQIFMSFSWRFHPYCVCGPEVPKLRPDHDAWDIEGDWAAIGTIYFVDVAH